MFNPRDTSPAAVRSMFLQRANPINPEDFLIGPENVARMQGRINQRNQILNKLISDGMSEAQAELAVRRMFPTADADFPVDAPLANQQQASEAPVQMDVPFAKQPITSPLESRINKSLSAPRLGIEDLIRGADDTADAPFASNDAQNKAAQSLGEQIFAQEEINADADEVEKLATNNREDVPDSLKGVFDENTNIAQILGGIVKLQNDSESTKLLKSLVDEKTTSVDAKKQVADFFNTGDEVPVWADVALAIGLDLLDPKTGTGKFFGDAASAGKAGLAAAKAGRGRSDAMNKLAFGIYREDKKNRQALSVQLAKSIGDDKKAAQTLRMDFAKFFQNQEKINQTEANNKAAKVISTLGLLDQDQKNAAYPVVSRLLVKGALDGVSTEDVPAHVFGMLKSEGLKLENVKGSEDISPSEITISDAATFAAYKEKFPNRFNMEFQEGKTYKVKGFADKTAGADELAFTNILNVDPSIGGQDEITRLLQRKFSIEDELRNRGANDQSQEAQDLRTELSATDDRLGLLTTRKSPMTYVWSDGQLYAAGEGAAGSVAASDAARQASEIKSQGNALAAAYGVGDNILRSLSQTDAPADSVGIVASAGKFIGGFRGQLDAVTNLYGNKASDNAANYASGDITDSMANSNERVGNTTVGKVFTNLKKIAQNNAQIQSQLMSFAYALAGSRETGKLTDKDVAAALITFGGGDIAEGKWFASVDTLIAGVDQALDTATNDYAIRYDAVHQTGRNKKYLREEEKLSETEIKDRTTFNLSNFLTQNQGIREGLADRVGLVNGRIKFQSLDKYRGDGAGNVPSPDSRYTPAQLSDFSLIDRAAVLFENNPDGLSDLLNQFDDATLQAYREFKQSQVED